jgi:hypothetical protein
MLLRLLPFEKNFFLGWIPEKIQLQLSGQIEKEWICNDGLKNHQ